jgi:hypothetical protein
MLRVQAFIVDQVDDVYKIEAHAEGIEAPFTFEIKASSETEAAMEALRRVEVFDAAAAVKQTRTH